MSSFLTVGHSTRSVDELIALLRDNDATVLVDVRTVPRSRHNPQFNLDSLPAAVEAAGLSHVHLKGLGGLRKPRPDSPNTGWRNAGFRGYADHMATAEFEEALAELLSLAAKGARPALMCAEAVPWRCHRSLIADALTAAGHEVRHILSDRRSDAHRLTPFASIDGTRVTYPGLI